MVSENFKEFVADEIKAIMESMDESCKNDPVLCQKNALEWIAKNAKKFRHDWHIKHELKVDIA